MERETLDLAGFYLRLLLFSLLTRVCRAPQSSLGCSYACKHRPRPIHGLATVSALHRLH